jgi:hypothetical protein
MKTASQTLTGGFLGLGKKNTELSDKLEEKIVNLKKEIATEEEKVKETNKAIDEKKNELKQLISQKASADKPKFTRYLGFKGGKKTARRHSSKSKTAKKHRK